MTNQSAQSFRNRLEDLLREARDAGYDFWNSSELEHDGYDGSYAVSEYYFLGSDPSDNATVSSDLINEETV